MNYEELNLKQPESEFDPFTEDRYKQFYKHFPKTACSVLDIGCNTGRGGVVLKQLSKNLKIHGLDAVRDRLERLPKDVYEEVLYGYSTQIPCEDNSFDVVVAGEFIEHIYLCDVDRTLGEIFRVLKVGGRLLLTTPNPSDIKRKIRGQSILGGSHVSQHFSNSLALRLKMSGFSSVRTKGSGKVTRYLGSRFPLLIYGSYLAMGDKF
jgi:ubiquinone/menaquinone biosynthesis C-methylase UbiE